ncbi:hypothetical protein [Eisenbergiella sp.]
MYEDEEYGFCPECGALMKNGVCISCGYDRNKRDAKADGGAEMAAPGENVAEQAAVPPYETGGEAAVPPYGNAAGQAPILSQGNAAGQAPIPPQGNAAGQAPVPPYGNAGAQAPVPPCGNDNIAAGSQGMPPYGAQNIPPYGAAPGGLNGQAGTGAPGVSQNGQNNTRYGSSQQYGQQQNGYYGQIPPGGVPPYGQQPYGAYPNMPPQKRNSNRTVAAVIVAVIAVLLCIVMILIFVIVKGAVREASSGVSNSKNYGEAVPEETIPFGNDSGDDGQLPGFSDGGAYEPETEEGDYVPSPEDDYYVTIANSIRDDLSYTVEWEDYSYVDDETGATATGKYPQLKGGNIPHLDELNEEIEYEATYYSKLYNYYKDAQGEDEQLSYATSSIGYVTYMDEEKISIVLQEKYAMNQESYISLYCINIDLVSGALLDNGEMIEYNEQLAKEFRDQDAYQNGTAEAVDRMDDEQLQDFLSDSDTNIIFYTPVGLEIGFNYTTSTSSGWVTATIKDYGRYMKKI